VIDISLLTKNHEIFKPEKDITFKGKKTIDTIVILLKGLAHQTLTLNNKRKIQIKHTELSYIGLEEVLMHSPHDHQITVKAGSEYLLYTQTEFLLLFQVQLNVTFDSIIYLCKQLRIHNSQGKKDKKITKTQTLLDESNADEDLEEVLYNISFSDADNIPLEISEKILKEFPANYTMMEEGELSNELYIIVEGEVSVFQEANGEIKKIAEHKATTMIGEMAQFDGLPRSATVITNTPIKALVFKPENFKMVFQLHPKWSLKIINSIASRITNIRSQIL
jgi:CRP-like cAMP-binding protein